MEKVRVEGGVIDKLYTMGPDSIFCTCGAGGFNVGKTPEILDKIKKTAKHFPSNIPPPRHCRAASR